MEPSFEITLRLLQDFEQTCAHRLCAPSAASAASAANVGGAPHSSISQNPKAARQQHLQMRNFMRSSCVDYGFLVAKMASVSHGLELMILEAQYVPKSRVLNVAQPGPNAVQPDPNAVQPQPMSSNTSVQSIKV